MSAPVAKLAVVVSVPVARDQQNAQAWEVLASEARQKTIGEYEARWRPRTTCAAAVAVEDFRSNSPTGQ